MKNLIFKELRLSASLITFFSLLLSFLVLAPNYPILMGGFFICLGIARSIINTRETDDIHYSIGLPVKRADIVKAKYIFAIIIQMIGFIIMAILTVFRMQALSDAEIYAHNDLMNANPVFLAYLLLVFAMFNFTFLKGFFKNAYSYGKAYILFIVDVFFIVLISEILCHISGLEWLNSTDPSVLPYQLTALLIAVVLYLFLSYMSYRKAKKRFELIDL